MRQPAQYCAPWISALAVLAAVATPVAGQVRRALAEDGACRCSIELRHVATLGNDSDSSALSGSSVLARGTTGRYYVGPSFDLGRVLVFEPDGRLTSAVGSAGRGPGELGRVRFVRVGPGDSVFVLDGERISLFSPGGQFVRSGILPRGARAFRFSLLANGQVLLNNYMPSRPAFILLDAEFREVRAFGPTTPPNAVQDSDAIQYWLAASRRGELVAVPQNYRFGIEVWDTTGNRLGSRTDHRDWFQPWGQADELARGPRSSALPRIAGIWLDDKDNLWIVASVADRREPRATRSVTPLGAGRGREVADWTPISVADYARRYDTVIEVIEWRTGRIVASQRFDDHVGQTLADGLLASVRELESGLLALDVWKPVLLNSKAP